ncbi:hypothetical protein N0V93_002652 [Gnomoniopsis smithogilvyi]|uniref:Chromo domain-containing protein n=1 Tax=Gnomoniopsis smithogilvyi TaxID=1191159 RepID=A0A9W8YZ22_9PEZI|nr:hypothetical protein N0V93_002652 [Gnomoniopsis smithogilvyi]
MPPAISDEEMSDVEDLPKKSRKSYEEPDVNEFDDEDENEVADFKPADAEEEEENDDEDLDEDEYVVEKIFSHYIADDGKPRFEVKWEGYDKKSDRTWEPEENLTENATEALKEYYASIGGKQKMFEQTNSALNGRKRQRQSKSATPVETTKRIKKDKSHPLDSTPPASAKAAEWKPPSGSWEDHVETVDMCQDENDGTFIVYLTWKNGKKTQHPKEVIYRRCPQKMLRFYERHIRISRDGGETVDIGSMTH